MRLSALPLLPGYRRDGGEWRVMLNGRAIGGVIFADEEAGEVWVLRRDADGNKAPDDNGCEVEVLKGIVVCMHPNKFYHMEPRLSRIHLR